MNFLCDQCKQKYHVADEKVRGKAVTRFKCKKCGHVIELRMAGSSDFPPAASPVEDLVARELPPSVPPPAPSHALPSRPGAVPLPAARTAPRPTGNALPTAARLPTSPSPAALKAPPAPNFGAPRPATAPLPTRSPALAPKPAPMPTARAATGTALPTAGALGVRAPATTRSPTGVGMPAARPAAFGTTASSPLRSGLAGRSDSGPNTAAGGPQRGMSSASMLLNASETGWYAGVRDVPVGPLTRGELATRIESGDISHDTLVWREGLDDWRPLRSVDELADLVRTAARKMSDGLLGTMGVRRNDAGSAKIVPMQARSTGGASTSSRPTAGNDFDREDEPGMPDDEPTRMTALADLVAKAEQAGLLTDKPAPATTSSGASVRPQQVKTPSVRPAAEPVASSMPFAAPAVKSAPPAATSAPPSVRTAPIPLVAPAPPVSAIAAPFLAPMPAATNVVSVAPTTAGNASASETTQHLPGPVAPPSRDRKIGGLPIGAWVMMVGVLVTGVAIGLALKSPSVPAPTGLPTTTQASTNIAAGPIAPIQRTVGQDIALAPADLHPPPPTVAPAAPENAAVAPTHPGPRVPGVGTAVHPAAGAALPVHQLTAAQRAALAQLDAEQAVAGGPVGSALSNPSATTAPSSQSSQQRASSVIEALGRTNVISNCWNAALRRNAAHPAESVRVQISVLPNGHASGIHVIGAQDPELATCVETRARGGFYGMGAATDAEVRANLALGQ